MEFGFTGQQQKFRAQVRDFVESELPPHMIMPVVNLAEDLYRDDVWDLHKHMARKLGERGWLSLGWPEQYGGKNESPMLSAVFQEELRYRGAPGWDPQGSSMVGPLILHFGMEEQKKRFLPGIASGEVSWCQGYSEPEAGSDLASLKTTAVRNGDHFILNGQKLWTSGAHLADWCHLLARTDQSASNKHAGLTYFLLDMNTPGISVRTIEDMCGGHGLCEVFFDNVRIPAENALGPVNNGWEVTMSQLNFERGSDVGGTAMMRGFFDLLLEYLKERDMLSDPLIRNRIASIAIDIETARILAYQMVWLAGEGLTGSAQASMNKLFCSEANQRCARAMMNVLGSFGPITDGSKWAVVKGRIAYWYLQSFSTTLARGSSEMQRTILATRGLGLPRS